MAENEHDRAASLPRLVGDLCPQCGYQLKPIVDPIDDFVARRQAILDRERRDLEDWVDQQVAARVGHLIAHR